MIYGVGTDIVEIARIESALGRFGERFARRLLGPEEIAEWGGAARPAHFLAKRVAAKEAAAKALGTGFREGIRFCDIVVTHDPLGRPGLAMRGAAAARLREAGIDALHLSLSDEREHAIAFVVAEKG